MFIANINKNITTNININNFSIISDYSDKYYIVCFVILLVCFVINCFCIGILVYFICNLFCLYIYICFKCII